MFTGLVEEIGHVLDIDGDAAGARLAIAATRVREDVAIGDSIAVDGVCLTVVSFDDAGFAVDVVAETLRRTALGERAPGDGVNLERALQVGDRLGGHIVQGHVDGTGEVSRVDPDGDGSRITIASPHELLRYVVEKGSITVNGVSLTVASRDDDGFAVALIPHTLGETTLGALTLGRRVNLEVDIVAKYVDALVAPYAGGGGDR
jgi:riboflavin synthase